MPYNSDFIPAISKGNGLSNETWSDGLLPPLIVKEANPRLGWGEPYFDRKTQTLYIDCHRCTVEAKEYNEVLARIRAEFGKVLKVCLYVCGDTLQEQWGEFEWNGFERDGDGCVGDTPQFKLVQRNPRQWETRKPKRLSPEEKAARLKEQAMEEKQHERR
jgi:hypothetical protein